MLFTPAGLHAQHGWHRPARARVTLGGEPARRHEQYVVISLELEPEQDQVHGLLH
jgi:acyl-coenzyme A thioesterase PaaI-like protein